MCCFPSMPNHLPVVNWLPSLEWGCRWSAKDNLNTLSDQSFCRRPHFSVIKKWVCKITAWWKLSANTRKINCSTKQYWSLDVGCATFEGSIYGTSCWRDLQLDQSPEEMPELCCIYSADSVASVGILDRGLVVGAARCFLGTSRWRRIGVIF